MKNTTQIEMKDFRGALKNVQSRLRRNRLKKTDE